MRHAENSLAGVVGGILKLHWEGGWEVFGKFTARGVGGTLKIQWEGMS